MNSLLDTASLIVNRFGREWRFWELRRNGAKIGRSVQTYGRFFVGNPTALKLADGVRLTMGTLVAGLGPPESLSLEANVYINRNCMIDCRHRIVVGEGTIVGPNVYICDYDHEYLAKPQKGRDDIGDVAPVMVGKMVWVGANVCIMKGVAIGAHSIIGAGSVVTKSIPDYSLAFGNPARVVADVREKFGQNAGIEA